MLMTIDGDVGAGKTVLETYYARLSPVSVHANYELKIPQYRKLSLPFLVNSEEPVIVCLDEVYTLLDARRSGNETSLYVSYLLFQSRKLSQDYICTLQLSRTLDVRFREMSNIWIEAEDDSKNERFIYAFYNKGGHLTGNHCISYEWAKEHIYPIYNTLQRISPPKDMANELSLVDPEDTEGAITSIIDAIVASGISINKITIPILEDYCFTHRYPKIYVKMCNARNKATLARG
jgi:hypothetical protein